MSKINNMKRAYEFCNLQEVALVDQNSSPGGLKLVNPTKVSKKTHNDIVELAMEIQRADNFVYASACNKLQVIAKQVRFLKEQARKVLNETKDNTELHHTACNFVKVPGSTYHLYMRPNNQKYFSMLSPEEWNSPHEFLGSFRLEMDQSWTAIAEIERKNSELAFINKCLYSQNNNCEVLQETPMDL